MGGMLGIKQMLGGGISIGVCLIVPPSQAKDAIEFIKNRKNTKLVKEHQRKKK